MELCRLVEGRGALGRVFWTGDTSVLWVRLFYSMRKTLCNTGKTSSPYYGEDFLYHGEGFLLYGEDSLYVPPQHDPKQNTILDWVNLRATMSYWDFVGWLGCEGRLGRFSVL